MTSQPSIQALLNGAQDDGLLSQVSAQALGSIDLGEQIQAGLGVSPDDVAASEVVLVTVMPDDSSSIRFGSNAQLVRDGHNLVIDTIEASKQADGVLMHNRYLNGHVLYPYLPLDQVTRMDNGNYNPSGGTPLYDQTVVLLGTVVAKTQQFADNGVPARSITLIITDGADCGSYNATARTVEPLVADMLRAENHIVAGMGIDDGVTDFRRVFAEMGIPDEWILTPGNSESEIRSAFQLFSQSAMRVSQSGAAFSQASLGGFGAP